MLGRIRGSEVHPDERVDATPGTDFFAELAYRGLRRRLIGIDPTGDEAPLVVVGASHEQHPVVVVEDRGVGADARGRVADFGVEAGTDRRGVE